MLDLFRIRGLEKSHLATGEEEGNTGLGEKEEEDEGAKPKLIPIAIFFCIC